MMSLKDERINQITGIRTTRLSAINEEVLNIEATEGGRPPDVEVQEALALAGDLDRVELFIRHHVFFPPGN
jgi:hypothetical protein